MALEQHEQILVESFREYLKDQAKDYLPQSDDKATDDNNFKMRGFEYQHQQIDEMFAVKTASLTHHDGICASFTKVHGYKYLDDPTFHEALKKEFSAQAIPEHEQAEALNSIPKIIKELAEEASSWREKDFGFNQDLDGVMAAGRGIKENEAE